MGGACGTYGREDRNLQLFVGDGCKKEST